MKIPKQKILFCLLVLIAFVVFFVGDGVVSAQKGPVPIKAPLNPDYLNPPPGNFGLAPHPVDTSHIGVQFDLVTATPTAWDWRTQGGATPVKDQSTCGSCWAFASIADFESLALIFQNKLYDFSEENLKECNYYGKTCATGGNAWVASNYLTKSGARHEACNPYNPYDASCITTCTPEETATGWGLVANDVASIKSAVYQYGCCYTSMYASFSGFSTYNGSYVIYEPSCAGTNHAVLITGWDDNMPHAGGTGAWIVKNSYGTGWGDSGYFYIAYGSACIGQYTSYYISKKHYCSHERLYHYDDAGWYTNIGYTGISYCHGLVRHTPPVDDWITHVAFWAVDDNMTCDINIYDDFNGTDVSNLLHTQSVSCPHAGYYRVELTEPLRRECNDDCYVDCYFNCTGYTWPVPVDEMSPIETNRCWISLTGTPGNWLYVGQSSAYGWDLGIRLIGGHRHYGMVPVDLDGDGNFEIVTDHGASGIYYYNSPWSYMTSDNPEDVIGANLDGGADEEVVADFGSLGVWNWNGSWSWMTSDNPEYMIPADMDGNGDDEIVADFSTLGYWYYNGSWVSM